VTGWFRYAYIGSLVLFLAGLVFQVYLVGQSLFVDPRDWSAHSSWGWTVAHGLPLLILISAAFSRLGRRRWYVLATLLISAGIHPFLAGARESNPSVAVLHPINAVLMVALTVWLLQDAWRLARVQETAA
jgi:hypothetical protein